MALALSGHGLGKQWSTQSGWGCVCDGGAGRTNNADVAVELLGTFDVDVGFSAEADLHDHALGKEGRHPLFLFAPLSFSRQLWLWGEYNA